MGYRDYSTARGHIVAADGSGDFTTIGAALTAAASGETIFIRPGTYTENPALIAGVNLAAFGGDINNVIVHGKFTFSSAGTVSISNIQLKTNSDYCLAVTGSAASVVYLNSCFINAADHTGIDFTSSSGSSVIASYYGSGDIGTTGIGLWTSSASGTLAFFWNTLTNSGASTTASTNSAGAIGINNSLLSFPVSCSSSGFLSILYSQVDTSATNTTTITTAGTGTSAALYSRFVGGSASALSVGSGTTFNVDFLDAYSTNTDAITGAGTLNYGLIVYTGSSSTNNVTTQTAYTKQPAI